MYCTNCGKTTDLNIPICPYCYHTLVPENTQMTEIPSTPAPAVTMPEETVPTVPDESAISIPEETEIPEVNHTPFSGPLMKTASVAYLIFVILNCVTLVLSTDFFFGADFEFNVENIIIYSISLAAFVGSILTLFGLFRTYTKAQEGISSTGLLTSGLIVKFISGILFFTYVFYSVGFDYIMISVYVVTALGLLIYFISTITAAQNPDKRSLRGGTVNMTAFIVLLLSLLFFGINYYVFIFQYTVWDADEIKFIITSTSAILSLVALCVYFLSISLSFFKAKYDKPEK